MKLIQNEVDFVGTNHRHGCTAGRPSTAKFEARKAAGSNDAGFGTSLTCNEVNAGYTYSDIYVWV